MSAGAAETNVQTMAGASGLSSSVAVFNVAYGSGDDAVGAVRPAGNLVDHGNGFRLLYLGQFLAEAGVK